MQNLQTTIQISCDIKQRLDRMKMFERETYNEVIERMIEDDFELSEQTKRGIEKARKGKSISHEEVKKRLGI